MEYHLGNPYLPAALHRGGLHFPSYFFPNGVPTCMSFYWVGEMGSIFFLRLIRARGKVKWKTFYFQFRALVPPCRRIAEPHKPFGPNEIKSDSSFINSTCEIEVSQFKIIDQGLVSGLNFFNIVDFYQVSLGRGENLLLFPFLGSSCEWEEFLPTNGFRCFHAKEFGDIISHFARKFAAHEMEDSGKRIYFRFEFMHCLLATIFPTEWHWQWFILYFFNPKLSYNITFSTVFCYWRALLIVHVLFYGEFWKNSCSK